MLRARLRSPMFDRLPGRIRLYKDSEGKWRVERCEEISGLPAWQLYAVRDTWEPAWVFAGWLSGKRGA